MHKLDPHPSCVKTHTDLGSEKDIDLRLPLNWTVIWDNDASGCRIESGYWSESIIYLYI